MTTGRKIPTIELKLFKEIKLHYGSGGQRLGVILNQDQVNALLRMSLRPYDPEGPISPETLQALIDLQLVDQENKITKAGRSASKQIKMWAAIDQSYSRTVLEAFQEAVLDPEVDDRVFLGEPPLPFVGKNYLPVELLLKFIAYSDALPAVVEDLNKPPNFGNDKLYTLEDIQAVLLFASGVVGTSAPKGWDP